MSHRLEMLQAQLDKAESSLKRAGYTLAPGAAAWKPPLGDISETLRRHELEDALAEITNSWRVSVEALEHVQGTRRVELDELERLREAFTDTVSSLRGQNERLKAEKDEWKAKASTTQDDWHRATLASLREENGRLKSTRTSGRLYEDTLLPAPEEYTRETLEAVRRHRRKQYAESGPPSPEEEAPKEHERDADHGWRPRPLKVRMISHRPLEKGEVVGLDSSLQNGDGHAYLTQDFEAPEDPHESYIQLTSTEDIAKAGQESTFEQRTILGDPTDMTKANELAALYGEMLGQLRDVSEWFHIAFGTDGKTTVPLSDLRSLIQRAEAAQ